MRNRFPHAVDGTLLTRAKRSHPSSTISFRRLLEANQRPEWLALSRSPGGGYFVEQPGEIGRYLEACIDHELGGDVVRMLSLSDAMEVKQALFGFFEGAEALRLERKLKRSASAPA